MPYTDSLNLGSAPNDGTGEPLRSAFQKLIDNDVFLKALADALDAEILANANGITDLEIDVADAEAAISVLQSLAIDIESAITTLQNDKVSLSQARNGISENSTELGYNSGTGVLTHTGLRVDKVTRPDSANYTLQLTDMTVLFYAGTNGTGTYSMPNDAPEDGQVFEIIDIEYSAFSNPLTIQGNGINILENDAILSSISLSTNGETVRLKYFEDENIYVKL